MLESDEVECDVLERVVLVLMTSEDMLAAELSLTKLLELLRHQHCVKSGLQTHSATSLTPCSTVCEFTGHEAQLVFSRLSL